MNNIKIELNANDDRYFTYYRDEEDCDGSETDTYIDYNEFNEIEWNMDLYSLIELMDEILIYPVKLTFNNFTWNNRTAYTIANHSQELIDKVFSLDNDSIVFNYDKSGTYIQSSNHDKPMGFRIDIETVKESDTYE